MSDAVKQIKERLNIVDVASQYIVLKRAGTSLVARCPFHNEKTPSFHVSSERGTYHCFGCGEGGDIFSFVEKMEGLDFKGALKTLAEKAGVELGDWRDSGEKDSKNEIFAALEEATKFFEKSLDTSAIEYLRSRGITEETQKAFRVGQTGNEWDLLVQHLTKKKIALPVILAAGLARKTERGTLVDKFRNRIMFPIADGAGRVIAFSGRSFGLLASPEAPKYLNSPETEVFLKSKVLYGFDKARAGMRALNCALLVEGQFDLIASHQAGWANAVATSGTAFSADHARLIHRFTDNLLLALDADAAGYKATVRSGEIALAEGMSVKVVAMPEGVDPADFIRDQGSAEWKKQVSAAVDIIEFLLTILQKSAHDTNAYRAQIEAIILPILRAVKSPIAREQYLLTIANRLGVSPSAVTESFTALPEYRTLESENTAIVKPLATLGIVPRLLGIIEWQRHLPTPTLDIALLQSAVDEVRTLTGESIVSNDAFLFQIEREYANDKKLELTVRDLIKRALLKAHENRLNDITLTIEDGKTVPESAASKVLEQEAHLLITKIAKIKKE